MKALFIDAEKREIREVEYSTRGTASGAPTVGNYVGGWIEPAYRWPSGDVLYVDEEGLLKPTMHFFFCPFRPDQPMAGNGLVVGREVEDDDVPGGYYTEDPAVTLDWLKRHIVWMSRDDFDRWAIAHAGEAASTITTIHDGVPTTETLFTYGQLHSGMARKETKDE